MWTLMLFLLFLKLIHLLVPMIVCLRIVIVVFILAVYMNVLGRRVGCIMTMVM